MDCRPIFNSFVLNPFANSLLIQHTISCRSQGAPTPPLLPLLLLHCWFHVELPLWIYPKPTQVRYIVGNTVFSSFLVPVLTFQSKNLPRTLYSNLQDIHGKLKPWHFPVILYRIFKDRIRRNELKPQKVVR